MQDSAVQTSEETQEREDVYRSQIRFVRIWLLAAGAALIGFVAFGAGPIYFSLTGLALVALNFAVALRWSRASRNLTATTHKFDGLAPAITDCLNAVEEPLLILDDRSLVVFANLAAKASLPNCKENNPLSFALRAPVVLNAVEHVLRGRGRITVEYHERVPVERVFQVMVAPILHVAAAADEPGQRAKTRESVILLLRDISQLMKVEHMRVDFIANASHELRTPLASIIGFIETLQGPARNDASSRERFLGIMAEQARRMSRLIDDLLSLSRIELSQHVPPQESVEISGVLRQIADTLSHLAQERGVEILLNSEQSTEMMVTGDRDELLRVFENLIENAIKYGQAGGRVEIGVTRQQGGLEGDPNVAVSVRDFGPGIAPEHVPRLTERFYRVDVDRSRVQGGTGLGLAIVKHIVNRHRGRLSIESQLGAGAEFKVVLPAQPVSALP